MEASGNLAQVQIMLSKIIDTFDQFANVLIHLRQEIEGGTPYLDKLETDETYAEKFLKQAQHSDTVSICLSLQYVVLISVADRLLLFFNGLL